MADTLPIRAIESSSERLAALEQRCAQLTDRCERLETEQRRFMDALIQAGKFLFSNPATKMITMSLPKEMKLSLQKFFGEQP
jgi:hypothetical protein